MVQLQRVPEVRESRFNCQGTERFGKEKGFNQIFWKDRFLYRKRSIRFSEVKVYCKGSGTFSGSRDLFYERFPKIFWKQRFLFGKVSRRLSGHEDFYTEGSRSSEVKVYLLKVLERFLKQRFMKGFQFLTERVSEVVTSSFNFSRFRKISFLKGSSARGHMFYNDLLCQGFPQPFPGFCRVCGLGPGGTKKAQVVGHYDKRMDCLFLVAVLREIDSWHFWQDRNDQDRHDKSDKGSKGGSRRPNKKQK